MAGKGTGQQLGQKIHTIYVCLLLSPSPITNRRIVSDAVLVLEHHVLDKMIELNFQNKCFDMS